MHPKVIVVGGGNSALEEAVSLTRYAKSVTIVHQFDHFQAFPHAIEEARKNKKISFLLSSSITEFTGENKLSGVIIRDHVSNSISYRPIDGVFVFIGYEPNTEDLSGKIILNDYKEIVVNDRLETSIPGVFAAGDCINKKVRQVTTAVADGTIAALSATEYIHKKEKQLLEELKQ